MTVSLVIQEFERLAQSGAYGGGRRLSATTELMLISLYQYESLYRWSNANGQPLTREQINTIDAWSSRAQDELMENVSMTPIGAILPFVGENVPDYALICNGGIYQRLEYPDLYDVLVDNLIIDANRFEVPNYAGRYLRGSVSDSVTGIPGGSDQFTLTVAQLPAHRHEIGLPISIFDVTTATSSAYAPVGIGGAPITTAPTGLGNPVTHRPQFLNAKMIIIAR